MLLVFDADVDFGCGCCRDCGGEGYASWVNESTSKMIEIDFFLGSESLESR